MASVGLNLLLLYALVDLAGWPVFASTAVVALAGTIVRFLANDRIVFGHSRPTGARFGKYAATVAGGFIAGVAGINLLVWIGVHYLLAAVIANVVSVSFNFALNFWFVWRGKLVNGKR